MNTFFSKKNVLINKLFKKKSSTYFPCVHFLNAHMEMSTTLENLWN